MKIFLDTANIEEIHTINQSGIIDGVTTNPSLVAKTGKNFLTIIEEICKTVSGPVSAEVAGMDFSQMIKEGNILSKISKNVVIKLPLTPDGLRACRYFSENNIKTNVTLCFSVGQAILAAKAGATYVSPFVGRLDDIGYNGMNLISDIVDVYNNYPIWDTQVLVASIRSPEHISQAAKYGADIVTIPPSVISKLYNHPMTDIGLDTFSKDWKNTGQKIL